jgi:regulator of protease activity HflC (stomatin/prohibitin superfamily)
MKGSFNIVSILLLVATLATVGVICKFTTAPHGVIYAITIGGLILSVSPRLIQEWDRGVLLRLGEFQRILEPGIAWIISGIDVITALVGMRIRSTSFNAEKALTRDTVPMNVDAVLFWVVTDAKRAILEVEHYLPTITWAAQTTLRDVIGRIELVRMISDREVLDKGLQTAIDAKT